MAATALEIRANRFDLLSRLADDLAHEVKNPLHAAVINLELLKRRVADANVERAMERIRLLEDEVALVHRLVDALLQLLRPSRESADPVEVDAVLGELMLLTDVVAKLNHVQLVYEPVGQGAEISACPGDLRHAVLNLVVNAIEAMRPGGGTLRIRGAREAGEVRLTIQDSGPGIRAADLDRIGSPGFSNREDGAGLGIAVARALVENAGGRLELESMGRNGSGAAFLIAIPRTVHA